MAVGIIGQTLEVAGEVKYPSVKPSSAGFSRANSLFLSTELQPFLIYRFYRLQFEHNFLLNFRLNINRLIWEIKSVRQQHSNKKKIRRKFFHNSSAFLIFSKIFFSINEKGLRNLINMHCESHSSERYGIGVHRLLHYTSPSAVRFALAWRPAVERENR